jgi:hypothetical protein
MCSRIQCVLKKRTKKKEEVSEREREKKNKKTFISNIHPSPERGGEN